MDSGDTTRYTVSQKSEEDKKNKLALPPVKGKVHNVCKATPSSSHTQYFKHHWKNVNDKVYKRITSDEYYGIESTSITSNLSCFDPPLRKHFEDKKLVKTLIPRPEDSKWTEKCPALGGMDLIKTIDVILSSPVGVLQVDRLENHLKDFIMISRDGFNIDILDNVCNVVNYLLDTWHKPTELHEYLLPLLTNMCKPILINVPFDVVTPACESLVNYYCFLGCLLLQLEDDHMFDVVSNALVWHLSACDDVRGKNAVPLHVSLAAAEPTILVAISRLIAITSTHRFPTFIQLATILVCANEKNCFVMMENGILENIFYRFNPYFPKKDLPLCEINPAEHRNVNTKIGASTKYVTNVSCLLLILLKTVKEHLLINPNYRRKLPCPDAYAQRCFAWAFRYESRAPEHGYERNALVVVTSLMLHIFQERVNVLTGLMFADIMDLSVQTEIAPRSEWTLTVSTNANQVDVQFKKTLIHLTVEMLHVFPANVFMIESRHWFAGLVYLIDPALFKLHKLRSAPLLYVEIRLVALQALVYTIPIAPAKVIIDCNIIRRMLWYIEWYSDNPYDLNILYWCVRVLHVCISKRKSKLRMKTMGKLFTSHGVIVLIHLCNTLLDQKQPPLAKSEAIISLCLRLLTSAVENRETVDCVVYPLIKWPVYINTLAKRMLDDILYFLEQHFVISFKWMTALLNLIWEGIVWNDEYRQIFISSNGIYKLLDLIAMTSSSVQCLALSVLCDIARAGDTVGQLVTWRSRLSASLVSPNIVPHGANIANLLSAIFKDECKKKCISLDENGIIQDLEHFLMSPEMKKEMSRIVQERTINYKTSSVCFAAADMAGSRLSKVFALLNMLSQDLEYKVSLADETYNLYKNIPLDTEQEAILLLCSHYLTMKLNETWLEIQAQCPPFVTEDMITVDEFLYIARSWAKDIQNQQKRLCERNEKKFLEEESSLYSLLGRVRLNISLDALEEVRCAALSAHTTRLSYSLLKQAIAAHHRRFVKIIQPSAAEHKRCVCRI